MSIFVSMILITAANRNISATTRLCYGMDNSSICNRIRKSCLAWTWNERKAKAKCYKFKVEHLSFLWLWQQVQLWWRNLGNFSTDFSIFFRVYIEWRRDNGVNVFIESNYGFNNVLIAAVNVILSLFLACIRLKNEHRPLAMMGNKENKGKRNNWTHELMNHRTVYYAIIESSITGFCCCCWWLQHEIKN